MRTNTYRRVVVWFINLRPAFCEALGSWMVLGQIKAPGSFHTPTVCQINTDCLRNTAVHRKGLNPAESQFKMHFASNVGRIVSTQHTLYSKCVKMAAYFLVQTVFHLDRLRIIQAQH